MLHFDIQLKSAVADLTRHTRRELCVQYCGIEFKSDTFEFSIFDGENLLNTCQVHLQLGPKFHFRLQQLHFVVYSRSMQGQELELFEGHIGLSTCMTPLSAIQCASHVIGDYCKAAFGGIVEG